MALTPSSVKRSTDATGNDILTLRTAGGEEVQAVAAVDDAGGQVVDFVACDLAEAGAVTYVGKQSAAGAWLVQRVDSTSGLELRYATVGNNPAVLTYAAAWAGRAGLTYGAWGEVG